MLPGRPYMPLPSLYFQGGSGMDFRRRAQSRKEFLDVSPCRATTRLKFYVWIFRCKCHVISRLRLPKDYIYFCFSLVFQRLCAPSPPINHPHRLPANHNHTTNQAQTFHSPISRRPSTTTTTTAAITTALRGLQPSFSHSHTCPSIHI